MRQFGASCLQKAFERKWENKLLLVILKICSMLSRPSIYKNNIARGEVHQKDWKGLETQRIKVPVVKVTEKNILPLSIPLRFLSVNIHLTNSILDKELRTSHIIGKNDSISTPFASSYHNTWNCVHLYTATCPIITFWSMMDCIHDSVVCRRLHYPGFCMCTL